MCSSRVSHAPARLGLLPDELEAVRAVDGHRVDAQPLQRLQQRLAGAPVERDALVHLRRLGLVLEQEDVRERVARAEHGNARLVPLAPDLLAELVDLGDRLLEVPVVELVGGHGGHRDAPGFLSYRTFSLTCATHLRLWR